MSFKFVFYNVCQNKNIHITIQIETRIKFAGTSFLLNKFKMKGTKIKPNNTLTNNKPY